MVLIRTRPSLLFKTLAIRSRFIILLAGMSLVRADFDQHRYTNGGLLVQVCVFAWGFAQYQALYIATRNGATSIAPTVLIQPCAFPSTFPFLTGPGRPISRITLQFSYCGVGRLRSILGTALSILRQYLGLFFFYVSCNLRFLCPGFNASGCLCCSATRIKWKSRWANSKRRSGRILEYFALILVVALHLVGLVPRHDVDANTWRG
jgi:hypothetical protein